MVEGGVLGVHLHLGDDGAHRHIADAPVQELLPEGVLQVIANICLTHGSADRQRRIPLTGVLPLEGGHSVVDDPHLGAVAVGHDHLVPVLDQVHDGLGGDLHRLRLLRQGIAQGVAAQSDDDALAHISITSIFPFSLHTFRLQKSMYQNTLRSAPRRSRARRAETGSFTLLRKIMAAMM